LFWLYFIIFLPDPLSLIHFFCPTPFALAACSIKAPPLQATSPGLSASSDLQQGGGHILSCCESDEAESPGLII